MSESAPRISEKARIAAARWLFDFGNPAQPWEDQHPYLRERFRNHAGDLLTAILPLLCGEPDESAVERAAAELWKLRSDLDVTGPAWLDDHLADEWAEWAHAILSAAGGREQLQVEVLRDQLDEAHGQHPTLEDLASLLQSSPTPETVHSVAESLSEIAVTLEKLPERAIREYDGISAVQDAREKAEQELEQVMADFELLKQSAVEHLERAEASDRRLSEVRAEVERQRKEADQKGDTRAVSILSPLKAILGSAPSVCSNPLCDDGWVPITYADGSPFPCPRRSPCRVCNQDSAPSVAGGDDRLRQRLEHRLRVEREAQANYPRGSFGRERASHRAEAMEQFLASLDDDSVDVYLPGTGKPSLSGDCERPCGDTDDLCTCGHVRHEHHVASPSDLTATNCAHCGCEKFKFDGTEELIRFRTSTDEPDRRWRSRHTDPWVEVEALQNDGTFPLTFLHKGEEVRSAGDGTGAILVTNDEWIGDLRVSEGGWLLRDLDDGSLTTCDSDAFFSRYEPATGISTQQSSTTGNSLPREQAEEAIAKRRHEAEHLAGFDDLTWAQLPEARKEMARGEACLDIDLLGDLVAVQPKDTHLSGDGERLREAVKERLIEDQAVMKIISAAQKPYPSLLREAEAVCGAILDSLDGAIDTALAIRLSPDGVREIACENCGGHGRPGENCPQCAIGSPENSSGVDEVVKALKVLALGWYDDGLLPEDLTADELEAEGLLATGRDVTDEGFCHATKEGEAFVRDVLSRLTQPVSPQPDPTTRLSEGTGEQ